MSELEQLALDVEQPATAAHRPMTTRERRERKAERLREWAEKRDARADTAYAGVKSITDRIPFGQPILVGHHSERGARADVRRIERGMDAFSENMSKASDHRSRAENIERQNAVAIYSDDDDATEQLAAKIARLEQQREHIKTTNAAYKREHRAELKAMSSAFARDRALPYPGYVLTNLSANIRRLQKRLGELQAPERGRWLDARYAGECRTCGIEQPAGSRVLYFKRARAIECESCAEEK